MKRLGVGGMKVGDRVKDRFGHEGTIDVIGPKGVTVLVNYGVSALSPHLLLKWRRIETLTKVY